MVRFQIKVKITILKTYEIILTIFTEIVHVGVTLVIILIEIRL